jgi:hypothetical protein
MGDSAQYSLDLCVLDPQRGLLVCKCGSVQVATLAELEQLNDQLVTWSTEMPGNTLVEFGEPVRGLVWNLPAKTEGALGLLKLVDSLVDRISRAIPRGCVQKAVIAANIEPWEVLSMRSVTGTVLGLYVTRAEKTWPTLWYKLGKNSVF